MVAAAVALCFSLASYCAVSVSFSDCLQQLFERFLYATSHQLFDLILDYY